MKNLAKLNGVKALSKNEQMNVSGGAFGCNIPCTGNNNRCWTSCDCPGFCSGYTCIPF